MKQLTRYLIVRTVKNVTVASIYQIALSNIKSGKETKKDSLTTRKSNRKYVKRVSKRKIVVPPYKRYSIRQKTLSCMGTNIAIPWIKYVVDDVEGDDY